MTRFTFPITHGLALDPTGQKLAAVGPSNASIFDTSTGQALVSLEGPIGHAYDVDFSPDGLSVAVCFHAGHLRRYDASTGRILTIYKGHAGVPHGVRKVAFHPGGELLASVAEDSTLRIWDVESGEQVAMFKDRADVNAVCWLAGGASKKIVFASDVGISIVDVDTRKGRARDTRAIAALRVYEGSIYTAWGDHIRVLDENLDTINEFPQSDVSRIRVAGDMLFAASWQGLDQGVVAWHMPSKTRRDFAENTPLDRHPQTWALALDASRTLLYAGITPSTTMISDAGIISLSTATT